MKKDKGQPRGKMTHSGKTTRSSHWVLRVFFLSMAISAVLSFCSSIALNDAGYLVALSVLSTFVALGIVFDILGVAVTAADPRPFHSMASHHAKGAKQALWLLKNADRVASICNDVVGDICGIVSGTTAAVIVLQLQRDFSLPNTVTSILVTSVISGLTIGGKAAGKKIAMTKSTNVVYFASKILLFFHIGGK